MRRLVVAFAVLISSLPVWAQTAALPVHYCVQPGVQAKTSGLPSSNFMQGIIPSCSVSVYLTGTQTLATTTPQSPFTANTDGSIPPIFAAVNQGYDVVLSGGILPNVYTVPTTFTDIYPSSQFVSPDEFTLTTLGNNGPATYIENVLNIPQYTAIPYPGAGIPVSTGIAWGASLPTNNFAYLDTGNTFANTQIFQQGANFNGTGSFVNENFWTFEGSTTEAHNITTFDIFESLGTATPSNNYGSMYGPRMQASYWTGTLADAAQAAPYLTCATGNNPLCTWSLQWFPDANTPPGGGTATIAESFPGPLTVPDFYDTALTVVNDCLLVGASHHVTEGPCTGGGANASELQGVPISATSPTSGYVLGFDGTNWLPVSPTVASGAVALTPGSGVNQTVAQAVNTTLAVNNLNNFLLASQYQTGGGNNGIANAVALNGGSGIGVVADPGYATTEVIPGLNGGGYGGELYSAIPNWGTFTHVNDQRLGQNVDVYTESGSASYTTHPAHANYYFNTYQVTGATNNFVGFLDQCNFEGLGQQINGFAGINLKSYWFCNTTNTVATSQGQHLMNTYNLFSNGLGDSINQTRYTTGGGASTFTDEGAKDVDGQVEESASIPQGVLTSVTTSTMQATMSSGQGSQGDGLYIGDITAAVSSGSAYTLGDRNFPPSPTIWGENGPVPPMATLVGTSYTPSILMMGCTTAFGGSCPNSASVNPSGTLNSASGGYAPGTLTVQIVTQAPGLPTAYQTTTSGVSAGDIVTVADGDFIEQDVVTAVPDSTHITIPFAKPHNNGFTISKGGYSGYGIEVIGATTVSGGVTYQQVWPVVGTLDATHLLIWDHNSQQNWSRSLLSNNNAACQTDTLSTFSNVGATITAYDTTPNSLFQNASNVTVSVPSNTTYNASNVTTTAVSKSLGSEANQAFLTYPVGSAPSGTVPTTGTITFCNSQFNLYPIAETLDVLNPSTHAVDGYFGVATYSPNFTAGDSIKQFHWPNQVVSEGVHAIFQQMPMPPFTNNTTGETEIVGNNFTGYSARTEQNVTATTKYQGYGGVLGTAGTNAFNAMGMFGNILNAIQAPDRAVINIQGCKPSPIGCGNAALSPFEIYLNGAEANNGIWDNTTLGSIDFGGPIRISHGAFSMTIYSAVFGELDFSQDQTASPTPNATLKAANYIDTSIPSAAQVATDSSGKLIAATLIAPVQVVISSGTLTGHTCTSETSVTMTGLVAPVGTTPGSRLQDTQEGSLAAVNGWGAVGGVNFYTYVYANNTMHWYVCNPTAGSISYGAANFDVSN